MKERVPNIFDTWLAGDLLCYVKIALGNYSRAKFLKICNRPVRYLSRAAFEKPEVSFEALRSYYIRKKQLWMLERLEEFETQLFTLKSLSPYSALHYIRKGIGYDEFLTQYAKERNADVQDWFEVLDEIQETAKEKESLAEWLSFVDNYGEMLDEMQREQQKEQKEKDAINLLTMHGSKGLEFQVVFIPTVNEGVSPYSKSIQAGEVKDGALEVSLRKGAGITKKGKGQIERNESSEESDSMRTDVCDGHISGSGWESECSFRERKAE